MKRHTTSTPGVKATPMRRRRAASVAGGQAPPSLLGTPAATKKTVPATTNRKFTGQRTTRHNMLPSATKSVRKSAEEKSATLAKVVAHLRQTGYPGLSRMNLSRPSVREFEEVATYLFRQLDGNWRPRKRFDEEFVDMLRLLRCPVQISKTALAAAGSAHTWPTILSALAWCVDVIGQTQDMNQVTDSTVSVAVKQDTEEQNPQKAFYDYAGEAYALFLAGEDEACAELKTRVERAFAARVEEAERARRTCAAKKDEVNAAIARTTSEMRTLPEAIEVRAQKQANVAELESTVVALEADARSAEARAARATAALADVAQRVEEVKKAAKSEETTDAILRRASLDVDAAAADIAASDARITAAELRQKDADAVVLDIFTDVVQKLSSYETRAAVLQLVPASAKNADGNDLSLLEKATASSETSSALRVAAVEVAARHARDLVKPALGDLVEALDRRGSDVLRQLAAKKRDAAAFLVDKDDAEEALATAHRYLDTAKLRYTRELDRTKRGRTSADDDAKCLELHLEKKQNDLKDAKRALDDATAAFADRQAVVRCAEDHLRTSLKHAEDLLTNLLTASLTLAADRRHAADNLLHAVHDTKHSLLHQQQSIIQRTLAANRSVIPCGGSS